MAPRDFPIWGSICDDIWAIDNAKAGDQASTVGPLWLTRAEEAWKERGVDPNVKKTVDIQHGAEVQGYFVHPEQHWVGVSLPKRSHLLQATFYLLSQHQVLVGDMERLVGKYGYVHSCRPPLRSIFVEVYQWLDQLRRDQVRMTRIPDNIWIELMFAAMLLPYAQFDMSSKFSSRVECSDASMSGVGRAWTNMPEALVHEMARLSDHPGLYTNLSLPHGIVLDDADQCPLKKLKLPVKRFHWREAGAPAAPKWIFLGEADAATWVAEDRLRRPGDDGARFLHPMDSASCVGAFCKGRSASRLLNCRCQKLCSIAVAGGHEVFYPWIPSADNPADRPSRKFETEARQEPLDKHDQQMLEQKSKDIFVDPFTLQDWSGNERFFVHLCSGGKRERDLVQCVEELFLEHGMLVHGLRIDPLAPMSSHQWHFQCNDLLETEGSLGLLQLVQHGRVLGMFASPPCSTFSAARHRRLSRTKRGPVPLRTRSSPWLCIEGRHERQQQQVLVGTCLTLICFGMLGELRMKGGWTGFGHPADPGVEPKPSVFHSPEVELLKSKARLQYYVTHQCRFGAQSRKPTGLLLPSGCDAIVQHCNHVCHLPLVGWDTKQQCSRTTATAKYPSSFCEALARLCVGRVLHAQQHGYDMPFSPMAPRNDDLSWDPWCGSLRTLWPWPEPSRSFLAQCLERCNSSQISTRLAAPQS